MICTSVVPCLSRGFTKIDKIISMFVLFLRFFYILTVRLFFKKWGVKPHAKTVKQNACSHFLQYLLSGKSQRENNYIFGKFMNQGFFCYLIAKAKNEV